MPISIMLMFRSMDVTNVINNPTAGQSTFYAQSFGSRGIGKNPRIKYTSTNAIVHTATSSLPIQLSNGTTFDQDLTSGCPILDEGTHSTYLDVNTIGV